MSEPASYKLSLTHPVIAIVGPTASGKSDLAQSISEQIQGEIISADSMQVYQGMDIGTGKVPKEKRTVPYFGLDLCAPDESYSAALFQPYARSCMTDIDTRGSRAVLCGGTGLYIRAAIDDFNFPKGDQENNPCRKRWTEFERLNGKQALWDQLNEQDGRSAALIHPHNSRRVIRALELLEDGIHYADQREQLQQISQSVPALFFGLAVDPEILARRIDRRVDSMIKQGLVGEVQSLLDKGFRSSLTAPQAIGYKELVSYIEGRASLDEAIQTIKTMTRRYAKRQRTWFRKDKRIMWLHADSGDVEVLRDEALSFIATIEATTFSRE